MNGIHLHVSALDTIVLAANMLIVLFLLRILAAHTANSAFGKALGAIIG